MAIVAKCRTCGREENLAEPFIDQICSDCHRRTSGVAPPAKKVQPASRPAKVPEAAAPALAQHVATKQRQSKLRMVTGATIAVIVAVAFGFVGFHVVQSSRARSNISLGDEAAGRNDFDLAISYYTQALRLEPNNAVAFLSRGTANTQKHDFEKAAQDCAEAIRLAPAGPIGARAKDARGYMYLVRGQGADYRNAVTDCTDAIHLDSEWLVPYFTRGKAHYSLDEFTNAIKDLDKAEPLKDARVFLFRGLCHLKLITNGDKTARNDRFVQQVRTANADFRRAIELDPTLKADIATILELYR